MRARSEKSFTELAAQSRELGYPLARSTLHKLCSEENRKLPPTFVRVEHFLLTCGVTTAQVEQWRQTYHRLSETPEATVPRAATAESMSVGEVGTMYRVSRTSIRPFAFVRR